MRIYLRLNQFLRIDQLELPFAELARQIGINPPLLKSLLDNDKPLIRREALSKVCDYLVKKNLANAAELPEALFARGPEEFWHLLWDRQRIELCMGVRPDERFNDHVVIAADSILQASLLHGATEIPNEYMPGSRRRMKIIKPQLTPSWVRNDDQRNLKIRNGAKKFYREFVKSRGDKALVCLGSIKSNPVVECVLSSCFPKHPAFTSQDDVAKPGNRACPFIFAYRKNDPHPPSISGGMQVAANKLTHPGIYYEKKKNVWQFVPWRDKNADAALVFYRLQKELGQLDLIMGGYSGRGTRCLAEYIASVDGDLTELWPPAISDSELEIGAFVVEFELASQAGGGDDGFFQKIKNTKIHKIGTDSIKRRLEAA